MFESLSWEVAVVVPACLWPGLVSVLRLAVNHRGAVLLERERRATLAVVLGSPGVLVMDGDGGRLVHRAATGEPRAPGGVW